MTKTEIIAELRRSAELLDVSPDCLSYRAFEAVLCRGSMNEYPFDLRGDALRTFLLLVAHALEDECAAT